MSHTPRRLAALALTGVLALAACGGDDDEPVAEQATADAVDDGAGGADDVDDGATDVPFGLVDAGIAAGLADDPDIVVIDVRTPEEYAEGHLAGAEMIDFYAADFADRLAELDPDQEYLIYCRSGNRSGQTRAMLADLGVDQVYDLDGGINVWAAEGLPLER